MDNIKNKEYNIIIKETPENGYDGIQFVTNHSIILFRSGMLIGPIISCHRSVYFSLFLITSYIIYNHV